MNGSGEHNPGTCYWQLARMATSAGVRSHCAPASSDDDAHERPHAYLVVAVESVSTLSTSTDTSSTLNSSTAAT